MKESTQKRENLASRLGFILLSAGCAIGIGNVWRFPYITGQSGGGWFVLIYLFCLAMIGIPILLMEFATGRAAQLSVANLHGALTPTKPLWRIHGVAGFVGLVTLMMFYTVVTGWMLIYFVRFATGFFADMPATEIPNAFTNMLANPVSQIIALVVVCVSAVAVCMGGLQKSLERVTKWLMLVLFVLILVLAIHSLVIPGALKGLEFFLVPNTERLLDIGLLKVISNAMNQAFFTLSLGIGSMAVFGSYIGKERSLLGESLNVVSLDTFVAICSGLIVIPACFAFNVEPGQGPGLVFVTLPHVFCNMAGGRFWGSLFFLFMFFAAFTTVLAVLEGILSGICEWTHWGRKHSCVVMLVAVILLSLPCALGFNLWKAFQPLGAGTNVLDLEDFFVSDILLPFGGLAFALYCCHRYGWGWDNFIKEVNTGKGKPFPTCLRWYCAYILPIIIIVIGVSGLLRRFCGIDI